MNVPLRLRARLSTAVLVIALPASLGAFSPDLVRTIARTAATSTDAAVVSTVPVTARSLTAAQRRYLARVAPGLDPQTAEQPTTIAAGLALRTAADRKRRISVSSAKGSRTWTASALAEHDLPSAAMRAYKRAARTIESTNPGCHLPWTLLAGIGRVESDHGRYGGSVLSNDGVPRPAIVGIALNGVGPVAAIRDTDNGAFDGDTVWDRAVGPMQFIPSTWRGAGRDGDRDGRKSPNDIDDASLAAAGYLCAGGRDLTSPSAVRAAVFSYNASDYYVDLVGAFARGYRTGTFAIPSPPVAPGAGDGVVHLKADTSGADKAARKAEKAEKKAARAAAEQAAKAAKAARAAAQARQQAEAEQERARAEERARKAREKAEKHKPAPKPPKATPRIPRPATLTLSGRLGGGGPWTVAGTALTSTTLSGLGTADLDRNGRTESLAAELNGVVRQQGTVRVRVTKTWTSPTTWTLRATSLVVTSLVKPNPPSPSPSPSLATPSASATP